MRLELIHHPDKPPRSVERVRVSLAPNTMGLSRLEYRVFASDELAVPKPTKPGRRDELWKTTCFELFTRFENDAGYQEYNFSPSRDWAAYSFTAHRQGRRNLETGPLVISGWDAQALLLGFGFSLALIAVSLGLAGRQLKVRMART